MYPEIYNADKIIRLAELSNITSNVLSRQLNRQITFDFKCFEAPYKTEYLVEGNLILLDDFFDIIYIGVDHDLSGKVEYDIKCEHVFYRLLTSSVDNYAYTGTLSEILANILIGTEFAVGNVKTTTPFLFVVNKNLTKMALVLQLATLQNVKIGFGDNGFSIDMLDVIGADNGYEIRINKNIKGISKMRDLRGSAKTTYKVDVVDIFKSNNLIDLGLADLESVRIGDLVHVIDEVMDIDITLAVLELKEDVIKNMNLDVTLDSSFETLADSISNVYTTAIKDDDIRYGVKINNEDGLEIERYDKLARSRFNADEWKAEVGDGLGGYTNALFFDILAGKYKFIGDLDATGTITGGHFIGGTINIGSGTFTVDSSGNVIANSLEVNGGDINGGTISGTSISGANITGGVITSGTIINVGTDLTVGNNIYLGDVTNPSIPKTIKFNNGSSISTFEWGVLPAIKISTAVLDMEDSISIWIGKSVSNVVCSGDWNFDNANVQGLPTSTAVWG